MYGFTNSIRNLSSLDLYCAYSGPDPKGGSDIWIVGLLKARSSVSGIDIDYIRAARPQESLSYYGQGSSLKFKTAGWVKIRQMVPIYVANHESDRTTGIIVVTSTMDVLVGEPNPALDEARKYDGGNKQAERGTEAVKQAINQWEQMLKSSAPPIIGG